MNKLLESKNNWNNKVLSVSEEEAAWQPAQHSGEEGTGEGKGSNACRPSEDEAKQEDKKTTPN
eukprot:1253243-Prorocentrum_lima.AAC.1